MACSLRAIVFLIFAFAPLRADSVFLFADCSDSSNVKRVIQTSDRVTVRHSLAGGPETCYSVSVTGATGEVVQGYLLGETHPAVVAFERQEESYVAQSLSKTAESNGPSSKPAVHAKRAARKFWNPFATK